MPVVVGIHFVCRGELGVTDHGDGTFDTASWTVAREHCDTVEYVALHEAKDRPSYRQGRVLSWRMDASEGQSRVIFTVEENDDPKTWVGGGTGERGYAYR